jgi:hypothetical protein
VKSSIIGKSRLTREIGRRAATRGIAVVTGRAVPQSAFAPYRLLADAVGADNLCHLAGCSADAGCSGPAPARAWDDLRLVGLKLIFLIVTRAVSLLCLSRREWWWKDAEVRAPRTQLEGAM